MARRPFGSKIEGPAANLQHYPLLSFCWVETGMQKTLLHLYGRSRAHLEVSLCQNEPNASPELLTFFICRTYGN